VLSPTDQREVEAARALLRYADRLRLLIELLAVAYMVAGIALLGLLGHLAYPQAGRAVFLVIGAVVGLGLIPFTWLHRAWPKRRARKVWLPRLEERYRVPRDAILCISAALHPRPGIDWWVAP
jgi:hypothetical protein